MAILHPANLVPPRPAATSPFLADVLVRVVFEVGACKKILCPLALGDTWVWLLGVSLVVLVVVLLFGDLIETARGLFAPSLCSFTRCASAFWC